MREMKDSGVEWIDKIPKEWKITPLKTLFSFGKGLPITKDNLTESGIAVISYGQIHAKWNSGVTTHRELFRFVGKEYLDTNATSLVKKGDFILADTSEDKDGCGNCAYIDKDEMIFAGYHTIILRSLCGSENRYFAYLFLTDSWRSQIRKAVSGVKLFSISKRILASCSVIVPDNFQNIVTFLDKKITQIDALIANQQTQIEKLKAYKQSLITEVVTKGLDPDVPMKDSGVEWIGMIPNKWRISRIGLHYSIVLGKMLCPRQTDSTYTLEEYFCAANVHFGEICTDELKEMWFSPTEKRQYHIETGDMLIVEGGAGAGGCAIVQSSTSALAQNSIMIVRNLRGTDNRYLCYFIESLVKRGYIDVICNKATIPHFTKEKLSKTQFPVCSQEDQILISDYLDKKCSKIDRLISLKQAKIEKLEQYKKSLIYEYVTGKREVM